MLNCISDENIIVNDKKIIFIKNILVMRQTININKN